MGLLYHVQVLTSKNVSEKIHVKPDDYFFFIKTVSRNEPMLIQLAPLGTGGFLARPATPVLKRSFQKGSAQLLTPVSHHQTR